MWAAAVYDALTLNGNIREYLPMQITKKVLSSVN